MSHENITLNVFEIPSGITPDFSAMRKALKELSTKRIRAVCARYYDYESETHNDIDIPGTRQELKNFIDMMEKDWNLEDPDHFQRIKLSSTEILVLALTTDSHWERDQEADIFKLLGLDTVGGFLAGTNLRRNEP